MLHIVEIPRRHDGKGIFRIDIFESIVRGVLHGPGVKPGNLVVGLIGGDIRTGGQGVIDLADSRRRQLVAAQPLFIAFEIAAGRGDNQRCFTQKRQGIGDITRCSAEFFGQSVHREADV